MVIERGIANKKKLINILHHNFHSHLNVDCFRLIAFDFTRCKQLHCMRTTALHNNPIIVDFYLFLLLQNTLVSIFFTAQHIYSYFNLFLLQKNWIEKLMHFFWQSRTDYFQKEFRNEKSSCFSAAIETTNTIDHF